MTDLEIPGEFAQAIIAAYERKNGITKE